MVCGVGKPHLQVEGLAKLKGLLGATSSSVKSGTPVDDGGVCATPEIVASRKMAENISMPNLIFRDILFAPWLSSMGCGRRRPERR